MIERNVGSKDLPVKYKTKKFSQRVLPARWDNESGPWMTATSVPDDYVHFSQPRSVIYWVDPKAAVQLTDRELKD
jgi:hypothetical protein